MVKVRTTYTSYDLPIIVGLFSSLEVRRLGCVVLYKSKKFLLANIADLYLMQVIWIIFYRVHFVGVLILCISYPALFNTVQKLSVLKTYTSDCPARYGINCSPIMILPTLFVFTCSLVG